MAMLYFAYRNCQKATLSVNGSSITEESRRELS